MSQQTLGDGACGQVRLINIFFKNKEYELAGKFMHPRYEKDEDTSIEWLGKLENECEILKFLHENQNIRSLDIVKFYGSINYSNPAKNFYILLEKCDTDLVKVLAVCQFNFSSIADWSQQLFNAVDFLRRQKIVHGDIAPQNVLINKMEGETLKLKLCDFERGCNYAYSKDDFLKKKSMDDLKKLSLLVWIIVKSYLKHGDQLDVDDQEIARCLFPPPKAFEHYLSTGLAEFPEDFRVILKNFQSCSENKSYETISDSFSTILGDLTKIHKRCASTRKLNWKMMVLFNCLPHIYEETRNDASNYWRRQFLHLYKNPGDHGIDKLMKILDCKRNDYVISLKMELPTNEVNPQISTAWENLLIADFNYYLETFSEIVSILTKTLNAQLHEVDYFVEHLGNKLTAVNDLKTNCFLFDLYLDCFSGQDGNKWILLKDNVYWCSNTNLLMFLMNFDFTQRELEKIDIATLEKIIEDEKERLKSLLQTETKTAEKNRFNLFSKKLLTLF